MTNAAEAIDAILEEYSKASAKYPKFNGFHEGYGVLKEEVDEFWDEVKKKDRDREKLKDEAIQVGAMAELKSLGKCLICS